MTTYILWHIDDDEAFRLAYYNLTGERVQTLPRKNGTARMIGTNNCNDEVKQQLSVQLPNLEYHNTWPEDWNDDDYQSIVDDITP